jgi:hypothetical protein
LALKVKPEDEVNVLMKLILRKVIIQ